jgi:hypothetical protein
MLIDHMARGAEQRRANNQKKIIEILYLFHKTVYIYHINDFVMTFDI